MLLLYTTTARWLLIPSSQGSSPTGSLSRHLTFYFAWTKASADEFIAEANAMRLSAASLVETGVQDVRRQDLKNARAFCQLMHCSEHRWRRCTVWGTSGVGFMR
jgi:hypothetical protein